MAVVQAFDGAAGAIQIAPGVRDFDARRVYSEWKRWVQSGAGAAFPSAFRALGGDPVDGAARVGEYYFLQNAHWRIHPAEEDHELTVRGNLYGEEVLSPLFAQTLGAFTVAIRIDRSSLTQLVETGVSGLTAQEAADLALISKLLRNRVETDPATGLLRVFDDDSQTILLQGGLYNDVAGTTAYDGSVGPKRRDRLT